jgi:hypothetical protein
MLLKQAVFEMRLKGFENYSPVPKIWLEVRQASKHKAAVRGY